MCKEEAKIFYIDEDQFAHLYERLSSKVYRIAYLYTSDHDTARDILQDVFMTLWNNREKTKLIQPVEHYLFQCTRNKAVDYIRSHHAQYEHLSVVKPEQPVVSDSTEETVAFRLLEQRINRLVNELPEKRRLVYTLSRNQGLDNRSIALRLKITEKTVKNHLNHALGFLRKNLKDYLY